MRAFGSAKGTLPAERLAKPLAGPYDSCEDRGHDSLRGLVHAAVAGLMTLSAGYAHAGNPGAPYRLLLINSQTVKWGSATLGSAASVTYAIIDVPITFAGARNCGSTGPIDPLLATSHVTRSAFEAALRAAFADWSAVADIAFMQVDDTASADILVGAQQVPTGRAFTNVTPSAAVDVAHASLGRSVICLNPQTGWKTAFGGNLDVYDLTYTLMHEIGHAIGLDHPGRPGELMDFRYGEDFATLQPGDRAGAIALYGPRGTSTTVIADQGNDGTQTETVERALASTETTGPAGTR